LIPAHPLDDLNKDDEASKTLALVALARAQAKAGDKAGARERLREAEREAGGIHQLQNVINDDPARSKDEALQEVGLAQAESGISKKRDYIVTDRRRPPSLILHSHRMRIQPAALC